MHSFPLIIVDLNNSTRSFFPMEYLNLKENFQKSSSAKWPLPSCKKAFRVFEGKIFNFFPKYHSFSSVIFENKTLSNTCLWQTDNS